MRGTDLYKYSREGRETAPVSLVMGTSSLGNLAPCNGEEMDGAPEQSFCEGFQGIEGTT